MAQDALLLVVLGEAPLESAVEVFDIAESVDERMLLVVGSDLRQRLDIETPS